MNHSTFTQTTMCKQFSFFAGLWGSVLLTACTQQPEDIRISELKSVCEFLNASSGLSNQYIQLVGDRNLGELTMKEDSILDELMLMKRNIDEAGAKKYTISEMKECPEYQIAMNNLARVNEIILNTRVVSITSENDNIKRLLGDMLSVYDTLRIDNHQKSLEIKVNRNQIKLLMNKLDKGGYDLSRARKEAENLRKIFKSHVSQIESDQQEMVNAPKEQLILIYKHIPTGQVKEFDASGAYPWDDADYEYVDRRFVIMEPK